MDGIQSGGRRLLSPTPAETIMFSYSESARHLVPPLVRACEQHGLASCIDEKLSSPGNAVKATTSRLIGQSALLCMLLGRRCHDTAWQLAEAQLAGERGIPVLCFVEDLRLSPPADLLPALVSSDVSRIANFVARSRPDSATLWEYGRTFFMDRTTAARYRRAANGAWHWQRVGDDRSVEYDFEMSIMEEEIAPLEVTGVQALGGGGQAPALLLATSDGKHYRLAYSHDIRAVIPAPVFPGAPLIGFMHMDFDSAREWPRAGEAPVELRLLGRDVYGWHMSEYFWRAFVGSLPKMLGQPAASPR